MSISKFALSLFERSLTPDLNAASMKVLDSLIANMDRTITSEEIVPFMRGIGEKGCAFCPSTFKGERGKRIKNPENFKQSQLFVLSFDNMIENHVSTERPSFKDIKARAERYGLPMLFAYCKNLFRWTETKRREFSIVFLNETPIYDLREAEALQRALMVIFPEADRDCSVLKLSTGGQKLLYSDETMPTINAEWLLMNMCLYLKDRYGSTNYRRKLAEYERITGIKLDARNLPEISVTEVHVEDLDNTKDDKNSSKCIIDISGSDEILSHQRYKINFQNESTSDGADGTSSDSSKLPDSHGTDSAQRIHSTYSSELLEALSSTCGLYREFESCSKRLTQQELLGLATNLSQIKSGQKKFNAILSSEMYGGKKTIEKWKYYFYFIRGKGPKPCSSFCPYYNVCQHGRDILSTAKPKYHQIEQLANWGGEPLVDLEEAEEDFKEKFDEAVASNEQCWHIIKSQTALGKTETVLKFLQQTTLRVLIAVPTNKLKREVYIRAKKMGNDLAISPSYHELEDDLFEDDWEEIEALLDIGKSPTPLIEKWIAMAESDEKITVKEAKRAKLLKRYKRELSAFYDSKGHAITTHRRLGSMDLSKYDLVIVDEDIIYSTIIPNRETVSISDLKELKKELSPKDPLAMKIKEILRKRRKIKKDGDLEYFKLKGIDYAEEYDNIEVEINIPAMCYSAHFSYREPSDQDRSLEEDSVTFVKEVKFPEGTKYIMLSATADKFICELYFGKENVKFYECKEAEITGILLQYADKAMGRSSIRKDLSIFEKIEKWTKVEDTISFKEFHPYYTGSLHYGNCAGFDIYKGCNINVIGTPHQPEWVYKLFAYSLGYDVDDRLKHTTVVHNGFKFRFMTYEDEILRAIQFYMIESEFVGRARLLRCNCTVNLFSDFPLKQATLKESEYDKEESEEQTNS